MEQALDILWQAASFSGIIVGGMTAVYMGLVMYRKHLEKSQQAHVIHEAQGLTVPVK